jgi:hypothetical protein
VDHALSRFAKAGLIARVARGVFVRPKENPYIGKVLPGPKAVARVIAEKTGTKVESSGAHSAAEFQLSTQLPVAPVFYTSGPTRRFRMGATQVTLKHVSPRKLALAGRRAGTALTALWYLGKHEVTESVIEQVRQKLSPEEFAELKRAVPLMPAWMADVIHRHERRAQWLSGS